jgi:hypothetical protein
MNTKMNEETEVTPAVVALTQHLNALADGKILVNPYGARIALRDGFIRFLKFDGSCSDTIVSANDLFSFDISPRQWFVQETEADFLHILHTILLDAKVTDPHQRFTVHRLISQRLEMLKSVK